MKLSVRSSFSDVDAFPENAKLIAYLDHVRGLPFIIEAKQRSYAALRAGPGDTVLDLGCGLGDDVAALTQIVGNEGHVHGIDLSETMLKKARERHVLLNNCTFGHADVTNLQISTASFDAVRAERCLLHVADPQKAIAEMVRVVKPGGRLVIVEADWNTLSFNMKDKTTTALIIDYLGSVIQNGSVVRDAPALLFSSGCVSIEAQAITPCFMTYQSFSEIIDLLTVIPRIVQAGVISDAVAIKWLTDLQNLKPFFASISLFILAAIKT